MYGHGCYQAEVSLGNNFGWPHILGTHTQLEAKQAQMSPI